MLTWTSPQKHLLRPCLSSLRYNVTLKLCLHVHCTFTKGYMIHFDINFRNDKLIYEYIWGIWNTLAPCHIPFQGRAWAGPSHYCKPLHIPGKGTLLALPVGVRDVFEEILALPKRGSGALTHEQIFTCPGSSIPTLDCQWLEWLITTSESTIYWTYCSCLVFSPWSQRFLISIRNLEYQQLENGNGRL